MFTEGQPLPSLYNNGAFDPDNWAPSFDNRRDGAASVDRPEQGDLVAWRYAAWVVHEVTPIPDYDLTDKDRARYAETCKQWKPAFHDRLRPYNIVLRHVNGPVCIKPGEEEAFIRLNGGQGGQREIHFTCRPPGYRWTRLPDPYLTCSCHGHPWPCQEYDLSVVAAHEMRKMDRDVAAIQPGVCAHCLEPITQRQKTVTFPEPYRPLPGGPPPTFHAGRGACWIAAEEYERSGRLVDDPYLPRIASCPGIRFIHQQHGMPTGRRIECTAGPACTGLHGPAGARPDVPCWHHVDLPIESRSHAYAWPDSDCGYRSGDRVCLGSTPPADCGSSINETAADLIDQVARDSQRRRGL